MEHKHLKVGSCMAMQWQTWWFKAAVIDFPHFAGCTGSSTTYGAGPGCSHGCTLAASSCEAMISKMTSSETGIRPEVSRPGEASLQQEVTTFPQGDLRRQEKK